MKTIGLISFGGLHKDPRVLYLARSLKGAGYKVICFNVFNGKKLGSTNCAIYKEFKVYESFVLNNTKDSKYDLVNTGSSQSVNFFVKAYRCFLSKTPLSIKKVIKIAFYSTGISGFRDVFYMHRLIRMYTSVLSLEYKEELEKVSVFYSTEMLYGGFIAFNLSKMFNKDLIFDVKELNSDMTSKQSKIKKLCLQYLENQILKKAIVAPCVSQKIIDWHLNKNCSLKEKFVLLENSAPYLNLINKGTLTPVKFILSAGSSGFERGIKEFLAIWEEVNPKNAQVDIRLATLSDEDKVLLLKEIPNTYGKSVFFINPVPEDELITSILEYDVGVIPYLPNACLNHLYCCPNKFGQYLSAGLAIFSSNTKYITAKIEEGKLGIIYDPLDIHSSAILLNELIANTSKLKSMKVNSQLYAKNTYNWDVLVNPFLQKLENLYKKRIKIAVLFWQVNENKAPKTVFDSLESFGKFSQHDITYVPYNTDQNLSKLSEFECIVIHYYGQSYRSFSPQMTSFLENFKGKKIIFAQDEYDLLKVNREKYIKIKPDVLFSACAINDAIKEVLYPKSLFPNMKIVNYLTGYVPDYEERQINSLENRKIDIFYRGNNQGFAYGKLGYEKYEIGIKMKEYATKYKLNCDIEVDISKQIYGIGYFEKLLDSRCVLATESGSSLIDYNFDYRIKIIEENRANPTLSYDYFLKKYPKFFEKDGFEVVNCVSPKVFEAILAGACLVCYEGEYSGVIKPNIHYIPLKKDWSNIEEVINKIQDDNYIKDMVVRAYKDIVLSNKFSYQTFINKFDEEVYSCINA